MLSTASSVLTANTKEDNIQAPKKMIVKRPKCPHNRHQEGIIDDVKDSTRCHQKASKSDTKEVVRKHIQRDNEVPKKRMLQHPSSVLDIKEVIENKVQKG